LTLGKVSGRRQERTAHATHGLTRALTAVLTPAARQRGFTAATLLAEWRHVVGPALANRCQPTQLEARGGVLHLQASSAAALEIQHATPQIIERVNTYFGFTAVRRLRLIQIPLRLRPAPAEPIVRPLGPAEAAAIEKALDGVAEGPLRSALKGLGHSLRAVRR
jgi:hypothetical protein